jgi:hypothetical protein
MSDPKPIILSQVIVTRLPVADHRRLKAICESHGTPIHQLTREAVIAYLRYLDNGQWAITLPAELIQPATDAARATGISLSRWVEACVRQSLGIPLDVGYTKGVPKKEHPENVTIFCKCGCGTAMKKYDWRWRERKYLNGHQPKAGKWLVWNRPKWKGRLTPPGT